MKNLSDFPVSSMQSWTPVFVFVCLQLDLEPEGKVYIHISLTGSFIDGKAACTFADHAQALALTSVCNRGVLCDLNTTLLIITSRRHLWACVCERGCV